MLRLDAQLLGKYLETNTGLAMQRSFCFFSISLVLDPESPTQILLICGGRVLLGAPLDVFATGQTSAFRHCSLVMLGAQGTFPWAPLLCSEREELQRVSWSLPSAQRPWLGV